MSTQVAVDLLDAAIEALRPELERSQPVKERAAHVLDWAMRGLNPFETGPLR
jgi:hypothetical protein